MSKVFASLLATAFAAVSMTAIAQGGATPKDTNPLPPQPAQKSAPSATDMKAATANKTPKGASDPVQPAVKSAAQKKSERAAARAKAKQFKKGTTAAKTENSSMKAN